MNKLISFALMGAALVSAGCQKEATPLTVSPESVTLYCDGTAQITASPAEGVTYTSDDTFYATVDDTGLITAEKVGQTKIIVSSSNGVKSIPVTVMPQYTLYEDLTPYIGASLNTITAKYGTNYTTATNKDGSVTYTFKDPTSYVAGLGFNMEGGKCASAMVAVSTKYLSMLTKYLLERYSVIGMQNDYYFFLNHDKNVTITYTLYSLDALLVLYTPYTS